MKSQPHYKVLRLQRALKEQGKAEVYLRGDHQGWLVTGVALIESHALELDVNGGRTLIVAPEDIIALAVFKEAA